MWGQEFEIELLTQPFRLLKVSMLQAGMILTFHLYMCFANSFLNVNDKATFSICDQDMIKCSFEGSEPLPNNSNHVSMCVCDPFKLGILLPS